MSKFIRPTPRTKRTRASIKASNRDTPIDFERKEWLKAAYHMFVPCVGCGNPITGAGITCTNCKYMTYNTVKDLDLQGSW